MFGRTVTADCSPLCNEKHDLDSEYRATLNYVNHEKTKDNKVFFYHSLDEVYQKQFGKAVENYNAKQEREDRKKTVKGYMEELESNTQAYMAMSPKERKKDNSVKSRYELLLYVGDMNDTGYDADPASAKVAEEILEEYIKGFPARNPCLVPQYGYLHKDEVTPHGGLVFVPCASSYKTGLDKRVSMSKALAQQGFPDKKGVRGYDAWIKAERAELRRLAEARGFTIIEKGDPKRDKMTRSEFVSFKRALDSETDEQVKKRLDKLLEKPLKAIQRAEKGWFGYSDDDYERLFKAYVNLGRRCLAAEQLNKITGADDIIQLREKLEDRDRQLGRMKEKLQNLVEEINGLTRETEMLQKDVKTAINGLSLQGVTNVLPHLSNDGYGASIALKRRNQLKRIANSKRVSEKEKGNENVLTKH